MPLFGLQPVIARDRVRYVGEPVAIVLATDPSVAESAAEQVFLDIDELDPVLDSEEALAGDILIHSGGTNVTLDWEIGDGDAEAIFAGAEVVVSARFREHRHGATPLETRGLVAEVGDDGRLTVWGPAKVKHFNLTAVASVLGLAARARPVHRARRRRSVRRPRRALPGGLPDPLGRDEARPAREVDRGPGRVADRPQPLAGADDRPRGRRRRRRTAARLPRSEPLQHGRVSADERDRPADAVRDVAARAVPLAGLPGASDRSADEQDAARDVQGAGRNRGDLRARADARPRRGATVDRPGRVTPSQSDPGGGAPLPRPSSARRRKTSCASARATTTRSSTPCSSAPGTPTRSPPLRGSGRADRGRRRLLDQRERGRRVRVGAGRGRARRDVQRVLRHRQRRPGPAHGARAGARRRVRGFHSSGLRSTTTTPTKSRRAKAPSEIAA